MTRAGRRTRIGVLAVTLLAVVALVGLYLFGAARFWFSSDDAVHCVMAEVAARQGRFFPRDWAVANGDLPILPPYSLIFPFLGVSYSTHALASLLSYLFLLASLGAFCQKAYGDLETTLLTTILVASGLSAIALEFLIAQGGAYTVLPALSLCLFGLGLEPVPSARPAWTRRALLAALVALLLTVTNPVRAVILALGPLALSWAAATLAKPRSEAWTRSVAEAFRGFGLPVGLGAILGAWIHHFVLLPGVTNVDSVATSRTASFAKMAEHLQALPAAWLAFLQPLADRSPASVFESVLCGCSSVLAVGLLACVAFDLCRPRKLTSGAYAVAWLAAFGIALPLGALVLSDSLYQGFLEIRYAMLGIVVAVAVFVDKVRRGLAGRPWARGLATVMLAGFSVGLAGQWHSAHHTPDHLVARYLERQDLIQTLTRHGVRGVLATYWNSYVLSVLSRGVLQAFPIVLSENGVGRQEAFHYLGIELDAPDGRSAVALADSEGVSAAQWEGIRRRFGTPRLETRSGPFLVWIYDDPRLHWALGAGPWIDREIPESRLRLQVERKHLGSPCRDAKGCEVRMRVQNGGLETLSSRGDRPLGVAVQALDRAGGVRGPTVAYATFEPTLAPGESAEMAWRLPRNEDSEVTDYRVCLLQEPATWLCHRTRLFDQSVGAPEVR